MKLCKYSFKSERGKKRYIDGAVNIYPPPTYQSDLTFKLENMEKPFATIEFKIYPSEIYISNFIVYINDPRCKPISTKEEMDALQGIGKILLCKLLKYFLSEKTIEPETEITVEAGPSFPLYLIDSEIVKVCNIEYLTNDLAIKYLSGYPNIKEAYEEDIKQRTKDEILLFYVCYLQHLLSVDEYYKKLNFDLDLSSESEYEVSVEMKTTVSGVLENC